MTAPTKQPVHLAGALNAIFGLQLPDAAAARDWLRDGGWPVLDAWIRSRPAEPKKAQPDSKETRS